MLIKRSFSLTGTIDLDPNHSLKKGAHLPIGEVDSVYIEGITMPKSAYVFMYGLEDSRSYTRQAAARLQKQRLVPADVNVRVSLLSNDNPHTENLKDLREVECLFIANSSVHTVNMAVDLIGKYTSPAELRKTLSYHDSIQPNVAFSDLSMVEKLFQAEELPNLKAVVCHTNPTWPTGLCFRVALLKDATVVDQLASSVSFYFSGLKLADHTA